jgi:hypothetical protein
MTPEEQKELDLRLTQGRDLARRIERLQWDLDRLRKANYVRVWVSEHYTAIDFETPRKDEHVLRALVDEPDECAKTITALIDEALEARLTALKLQYAEL